MIIHSLNHAPKLLHQKLVNKKINNLLHSIHPEFYTTNPVLSGSYLIKLIVAPDADYNDYDFYFTTEEDYENAVTILNSAYLSPKKTKNSISYTLSPDLAGQVQLIFRKFDLPENLILEHDFQNCQVAWFKNDLCFTTLFKNAWKDRYLNLSLDQLPDFSEPNKWLAKLTVLVQRINKYVTRYSLDLGSELKSWLIESKKIYIENINLFSTFDFSILNYESKDYFTMQSDQNKIFSLQSLQQTIEDLIEG